MNDQDKKMAFPGTNIEDQTRQSGLTKREYFAAKAMQAYASSECYSASSYDTLAEYSVKLADRVLLELSKK
jgi:hypothetical protein